MTFQEAAKKTGVVSRMDKGVRIYRDKHGAWSSEGILDSYPTNHTDWQPVETPEVSAEIPLVDEHILELLKKTKQQLDELIKLTEKYI